MSTSERPIYMIAHRCNSPGDIGDALAKGVNAVECDVRWGRETIFASRDWYVDHDIIAFWSTWLSTWLDSAAEAAEKYGNQFALIMFDLKTPENLSNLRSRVRDKLPSDLNILYDVSGWDNRYQLRDIMYDLRPNEGIALDYTNNAEGVSQFAAEENIKNFWYGNGITALLPGPNVRPSLVKGGALRDKYGHIKKTVVWTLEKESTIRDFINSVNVDSVLINWSATAGIVDPVVPKTLKIINASSKVRVATREDDAFAVFGAEPEEGGENAGVHPKLDWFLAWTGRDSAHRLNILPFVGESQGRKVTLRDGSNYSPAIDIFNDDGYIAWTGKDRRKTLNIMRLSDLSKITLRDTSARQPALTVFNNRLYLSWAGTNRAHSLNIMSSSDGHSFGNKATLRDTSNVGPALTAFNNRLYLGWTGTDGRLNIISSSDGRNFSNKVTLGDRSNDTPALTVFNNRLYLGWTGTNGQLNVMSSSDGRRFEHKVTLRETSKFDPSLAYGNNRLQLGWTGMDGHLNMLSSSDGRHFGNKETLPDTSSVGFDLAS